MRNRANTSIVAGADLNELALMSTAEAYRTGWLKDLEHGFSSLRTPCIAAVRGYAVSPSLTCS
jgi:enoyl-CoA hydratase